MGGFPLVCFWTADASKQTSPPCSLCGPDCHFKRLQPQLRVLTTEMAAPLRRGSSCAEARASARPAEPR